MSPTRIEVHGVAISFDLPMPWRVHWKLKIRDREAVETPHVSLLRKTDCWRISLRTGHVLDAAPDPRQVPGSLMDHVRQRLPEAIAAWNTMYPANPVYPRLGTTNDDA